MANAENIYLRRAASGTNYDGKNRLVLPPFSLRMNAYEKQVRMFFHIYNHHDISKMRDTASQFAAPELLTYLRHQRCFTHSSHNNQTASLIEKLNPIGLPNYIKLQGIEDFLSFADQTFAVTPDSYFKIETVFHNPQASRKLSPGHKVVMCKTQFLATVSCTIPIRKSLVALMEGFNVRCLDELSSEQVLKVKALLNKIAPARDIFHRAKVVCNDMFPSLEVDFTQDKGTKKRKRHATAAPPGSFIDRIASQVLPPELEGVLSVARTVLNSKANHIDYMQWTKDLLSAWAFGDEMVNFTLHLPFTLHLICCVEMNEQDKVCALQFNYWDLINHTPISAATV